MDEKTPTDHKNRWHLRTRQARKHYLSSLSALHGDVSPPPDLPIRKRKSPLPEKPNEPEGYAQVRLVLWIEERWGGEVLFHASPNGAERTAHGTEALKLAGMQVGWPDIEVMERRHGYGAMFLELKRDDGGAGLSASQSWCLAQLRARGYYAISVNGFAAAKEAIEWYLSGG
jgi:hypothetical protein